MLVLSLPCSSKLGSVARHSRVLAVDRPIVAMDSDVDGAACYPLGVDGPSLFCDSNVCEEAEVFLCTTLIDEPGARCVLQDGLSMNGEPVYACVWESIGEIEDGTSIAGMDGRVQPVAHS